MHKVNVDAREERGFELRVVIGAMIQASNGCALTTNANYAA